MNLANSSQRSTPISREAFCPAISELYQALCAGSAEQVIWHLRGKSPEQLVELQTDYVSRYGHDLELDLRGMSVLPSRVRGLRGEKLTHALRCLHGPRLRMAAVRITTMMSPGAGASASAKAREHIYATLALAGGEDRTLLADLFEVTAGMDLSTALRPIVRAHLESLSTRPFISAPERTVAIVVSSGNWGRMLSGVEQKHIGGYNWREVEGFVRVALDRGFSPVFYTPEGYPASPDALSLLRSGLASRVGLGLRRPDFGPNSDLGHFILAGLSAPRSLDGFDASKVAALYIAGGYGATQDLVGNPLVSQAAARMHERKAVVAAVGHATPALGELLRGGKATGASPRVDAFLLSRGLVLPEFLPVADTHATLGELGVTLSPLDRFIAAVKQNAIQSFERDGAAVITGVGPDATGDIARLVLERLAR